jgi:hypothetical protein
MSLNPTFPYNDKSAINGTLSINEIKDLKERGFKHWEKYLIPHCKGLLQSTYSEEYIQEQISEKYQLTLAVSTIAMLRQKHLISLGLMEVKKEKTSFSFPKTLIESLKSFNPFRVQLIITFKYK